MRPAMVSRHSMHREQERAICPLRKLQMLGRPRGTDDVTRVAGSLDGARFTFLTHRDGRVTGVVGLASPRTVMRSRPFVEHGTPIAEAVATLG